MTLGPHLIPHSKINSKWVRDRNIRAKRIEHLEDIIRENPSGLKQRFLRYNTKNMVHKRKKKSIN